MIERLRGAVRAIGRRGSRMARALRRAFGRWVARLRGALPAPAAAPVLPEQWIDGVFTDPAQPGHPLPYKLFVPAGPALPPRPLLLMLHGCLQDPADFAAGTRMNDLARAHGCLVLYPAQSARANGQRCWNWFRRRHQQRGSGEPALLAALTRAVMADHTVDPARVYVAGLSAGGAMADIVARAYPELFAAAGVHSGLRSGAAGSAMTALAAMRGGPLGPAPAGAAVPTIVFHGDADATVDAVNGAVVAQAALDADARPHPSPSAVHETQGAAPGGRTYTRRVHPGADGRSQVEHWLVHGAGHAWSGGSAQGSFTDPQGPDASAEMLRFFLAHARAERA